MFDPVGYKDRNEMERAFSRLKQFRATVTIASIMIWLRAKPDRAKP